MINASETGISPKAAGAQHVIFFRATKATHSGRPDIELKCAGTPSIHIKCVRLLITLGRVRFQTSQTCRSVKGVDVKEYSLKDRHGLKNNIRCRLNQRICCATNSDRFECFAGLPGVEPCWFYLCQEVFVVQGMLDVICTGETPSQHTGGAMLEGPLTDQLSPGLDHASAGLTQARKTQASEGPLIVAGCHVRPISWVSRR